MQPLARPKLTTCRCRHCRIRTSGGRIFMKRTWKRGEKQRMVKEIDRDV